MNFIKYTISLFCIFSGYLVTGQTTIYPFVERGKFGYKDLDENIIISPRFDYVEEFRKGFTWTVVGTGEYELLNYNIDEREVKFTGKYGFISNKGEIIFPTVFDQVISLFQNYAIVGEGDGILIFKDFPEKKNYSFSGKLGLIDNNGNFILPIQYNSIIPVSHPEKKYWFAKRDNKSYLFSGSVDLTVDEDIENINGFYDGFAKFEKGEKFGYIDESGVTVIPAMYQKASAFAEGKTLVKKNDRYFYLDTLGTRLPEEAVGFKKIGDFSEGFARVMIMDEYGYIFPDSTFFKYPQYTEATPFFNGIAYVSNTDSFGYLFTDRSEDIVARYENNPVLYEELASTIPGPLKELDSVECESENNSYFFNPFTCLNLARFSRITLEALRWAPYLLKNHTNQFPRTVSSEGTLAARDEFSIRCMVPGNTAWELFKKKVLLTIIKDPELREVTWRWINPYLKNTFLSMPDIYKKAYMDMLSYLEGYYSGYDLEKTRIFLEEQESQFAFIHPDGSTSPYRKTSALLDRLIIIYGVIQPEEVLEWVRRIRSELDRY